MDVLETALSLLNSDPAAEPLLSPEGFSPKPGKALTALCTILKPPGTPQGVESDALSIWESAGCEMPWSSVELKPWEGPGMLQARDAAKQIRSQNPKRLTENNIELVLLLRAVGRAPRFYCRE